MKATLVTLLCLMTAVIQAQILKPTATEALLKITVVDFNDHPRVGEVVNFENTETRQMYSGVSNEDGRLQLLVPKGFSYRITHVTLDKVAEYGELEIIHTESLYTQNVTLQFDIEPSDAAIKHTYILKNVFFDTGMATLKKESNAALDAMVQVMQNKPAMQIEIGGHTDDVGLDEANLTLSKGRADAVRDYLVASGISTSRITTVGYGETKPIATNETPEGRAQNRRTEVRILHD